MFISTPKLPSRQNLIDRFSMYMIVENNQGFLTIKWKTEPHLLSNIDLYKSRHNKFASLFNQEDNGRGLVQFWIDMALNDLPPKQEWEPEKRVQRAWQHLTVYCEETCYWVAKKLSSDIWNDNKYQSWEEYLFFARCRIYDRNKFRDVLAKYNSNNSLDTYITGVLINAVKDEAAVAKFSKWRLLHQKGDKELKEALVRAGRYEPEISRFLFARKYLKQVHQMNKIQNPTKLTRKKWQEPDSTDFVEAGKYYNSEKLLASAPHEVAIGANIAGEQLKDWMEICITALQNYPNSITPRVSLEALRETGWEAEPEDNLYILEQDLPTSGMEDSAINPESLANKIEATLFPQLVSLKPEQQEILLLYYGFGLNQKQIADKFKVTQGAIARRLQTIEIKLLKTVCELSQPPKWVTQYVAGWLVTNYQTPLNSDLIHVALVEAIKKIEPQEQEVLRLAYAQKLDEQIIANQLGISLPKLMDIIGKTKSKLEAVLIKEIDHLINKYLQIWLPKVSKAVIKSACDNLRISRSKAASLKTMNTVLEESLKILPSSK